MSDTAIKKVKRSDFATFLNVTPSATATYARMGRGITSQQIAYNPATTNETYIHEDSASTSVDSYAPTIATPQTCYAGDTVFDYIDGLRQKRVVGAACETDILLVYIYDSTTSESGTTYAAEKQKVAIQIDDFGGDGGASTVINYTLNFVGDATVGSVTISDGVPTFTAD